MEDDYEVLTETNEDDEQICPLCMELLDETDRNLFPCSCGYQVCLWCLHYIRNTMGNKCPACRQDYEESNFKYKTKPTTPTRGFQTKKKRESKDPLTKDPLTNDGSKDNSAKDSFSRESSSKEELKDGKDEPKDHTESLKDVRVIQRNLVYVVGIPLKLAKKEVLKKYEYFGQYGKIQHIVVNKSNTYNSHWGGPSYTAYITYSKKSEASLAIQGINGQQIDNKYLRASYGTTKYCSYFLKGLKCFNSDCFYLHQFGDERDRFVKDSSRLLYNNMNKDPSTIGVNVNKDTNNLVTNNKDLFVNRDVTRDVRDATRESREGDGTWVSVVSGMKSSGLGSNLGIMQPKMGPTTATPAATNETTSATTNFSVSMANISANLTSITANLNANLGSSPSSSGENLFSLPISHCLERYNNCGRLVQLSNVNLDRLSSLDTVKRLFKWSHFTGTNKNNKETQGNVQENTVDKHSMGTNDVSKDSMTSNTYGNNMSNSTTSTSNNKENNNEDNKEREKQGKDKQKETKDHGPFVPDEVIVNEIMSRIRRHTMMIDNLSKQYSNNPNSNQVMGNSTSMSSNNSGFNKELVNGNVSNPGFNKDTSNLNLNFNKDKAGFSNIENYAINVLHNNTAPPNSYSNNFTNASFNPGRDNLNGLNGNREGEREEFDRKLELEVFKILQVQLQRNEQFVNHLKLIDDQQ